jgi:hypothetical protein
MAKAHQNEKKSLTSFSLVCELMFLTLTVLADMTSDDAVYSGLGVQYCEGWYLYGGNWID